MSTKKLPSDPSAPPSVDPPPEGHRPMAPWPGRARIVSVALAVSSLTMAVLVAWQPGPERNDFSYEAIAATRGATWMVAVLDGVGMAIAAVTVGIAGCLLASRRGARWATVGATITAVGGIAFCGGRVAAGVLGWYATDPAALPAETGAAFVAHVEANLDRLAILLVPGFMLFTLGTLLLAVALWRARSVPRWWPIAFAALTVVLFVGPAPRVMDGVQAAQLALLTVVAVYAWQEAGRLARR